MVENAGKTLKKQRKAREHYIDTLRKMNIDPELMPFITVWNGDSITIPTKGSGYNYTIDWGDGKTDTGVTGNKTHNYASAGEHTVKISGTFPHIYFNFGRDRYKIKMVTQWGDIVWRDFSHSFHDCRYMDVNATDTPDLSNVTSLQWMFYDARELEGNKYFNEWDVRNVSIMEAVFDGAYKFNQDLSNWDVSNVTDMRWMFTYTRSFKNHDLSMWNVKKGVKHYKFLAVSGGRNIEPIWK
jgi:surface protein